MEGKPHLYIGQVEPRCQILFDLQTDRNWMVWIVYRRPESSELTEVTSLESNHERQVSLGKSCGLAILATAKLEETRERERERCTHSESVNSRVYWEHYCFNCVDQHSQVGNLLAGYKF